MILTLKINDFGVEINDFSVEIYGRDMSHRNMSGRETSIFYLKINDFDCQNH